MKKNLIHKKIYNSAGKLMREWIDTSTRKLEWMWNYEYDPTGKLVRRFERRYNSAGKLVLDREYDFTGKLVK